MSSEQNNPLPTPRTVRPDNTPRGLIETMSRMNSGSIQDALNDFDNFQQNMNNNNNNNNTENNVNESNNNQGDNENRSPIENAVENAAVSDNARNLVAALRSSQSFVPLVVLVILKLFHEYAVPIFFFAMFVALRMKLNRHFVEQVYIYIRREIVCACACFFFFWSFV